MDIAENIERVRERIEQTARRVDRDPQDITLVAVTKTVPVDLIREAIKAGVNHFGENRVQEAREKIPKIPEAVTWHMVGHLQKNKVKYAVELFQMIQSVDEFELAEIINRRAAKVNKKMPVLIEVNTSGEPTKFGCQPDDAISLLKKMANFPNLEVRGFMTIGLFSEDMEKVRLCFQRLKRIYEEARALALPNTRISILSMGMSSDFEVAIEEGSTMVRIGTAIFGPRKN